MERGAAYGLALLASWIAISSKLVNYFLLQLAHRLKIKVWYFEMAEEDREFCASVLRLRVGCETHL